MLHLLRKVHSVKKFMENPVIYLVGAIVGISIFTAYLPQIIVAASIAVLVLLALAAFRRSRDHRGGHTQAAAFCASCGHAAHRGSWCASCGCRA